jgi:hypothetical protein
MSFPRNWIGFPYDGGYGMQECRIQGFGKCPRKAGEEVDDGPISERQYPGDRFLGIGPG